MAEDQLTDLSEGQPGKRARRTGRPSLEQAEDIERVILETATDLYLRDGSTVTMKAIVQATGLSSKTVYARYPNKDAVFLSMLRFLLAKCQPPMDLTRVEEGNVRDTLRSFIGASLRSAFRPESIALHRLLSIDRNIGFQLGPDVVQTVQRMLMQPLQSYLDRMCAIGSIRNIHTHWTAGALTTLILAEPASRYSNGLGPPSEQDMTERAAFIAELFCLGIERH